MSDALSLRYVGYGFLPEFSEFRVIGAISNAYSSQYIGTVTLMPITILFTATATSSFAMLLILP